MHTQRIWLALLGMPLAATAGEGGFFKDSTDEWLEEWSESKWPDLIELQLQMDGRSLPSRIVWAVPETQLRSPTRRTTPTSNSTTTTTTTSPKGGNGGTSGGNAPR